MPRLISESFSYSAPAMMLYAFGLENLMKGIVVARDPTRVSRRDRRRLFAFDHNLLTLAGDVGLEVDDRRRDLLRRLITFSTWAAAIQQPATRITCVLTTRPRGLRGLRAGWVTFCL